MVTILDFLTQLVVSAFQLVGLFVTDVLLSGGDVVSTVFRAVSMAAGGAMVVGASLVLLYLAAGAVVREFGVNVSSPGRTRVRRD
ncbi:MULTISPECIES: hypothetical protein [Haloprofundus]|uniref:hypothetical protein n=1 Tax=Haloprofundus TaxID=1911573 RepID=UPI000E44133C|nr:MULTISPECIES: hypothetical protein [Haloprofundus]QCJ45727.1 hypothetical protein FCF25_00705 [Haloprofundus sp. MHR1]